MVRAPWIEIAVRTKDTEELVALQGVMLDDPPVMENWLIEWFYPLLRRVSEEEPSPAPSHEASGDTQD